MTTTTTATTLHLPDHGSIPQVRKPTFVTATTKMVRQSFTWHAHRDRVYVAALLDQRVLALTGEEPCDTIFLYFVFFLSITLRPSKAAAQQNAIFSSSFVRAADEHNIAVVVQHPDVQLRVLVQALL